MEPLTTSRNDDASGARELQPTAPRNGATGWWPLIATGIASCLLYALMAWLSRRFEVDSDSQQRPILVFLTLAAAAFALHVVALAAALRSENNRRLVLVSIAFGLAFRLILLPSTPIQEIDIYRYLWDGAVVAEGVSPFRFSPHEVEAARRNGTMDDELQRLVGLCRWSPALARVLGQIHYGELPTVYPPVSQIVFGAAAMVTPEDAPVATRILAMKILLLVFDLTTCALTFVLLAVTGRHCGWIIAYSWSPLVLKEIANSGHLDSIAVCLTTAAVVCLTMPISKRWEGSIGRKSILPIIALGLLALAVGAKLYAVVLLPLFLLWTATRHGWRVAAGGAFIFLAIGALVLWPMICEHSPTSAPRRVRVELAGLNGSIEKQSDVLSQVDLNNGFHRTIATPPAVGGGSDTLTGLRVFFSRWEMNDFLFLLAVENLKPPDRASEVRPWFSFVSQDCRELLTQPIAEMLGTTQETAAFVLTRALTMAVFMLLAVLFAGKSAMSGKPEALLEAAFLTLAWFWLLLPTQNPWYWLWALPLIPFARGRAWLAVSGLVLAYYLRFWLSYHFPMGPTFGTSYAGSQFFDFIVTWIEFGPWLLALFASSLIRRRRPNPLDCSPTTSWPVTGLP